MGKVVSSHPVTPSVDTNDMGACSSRHEGCGAWASGTTVKTEESNGQINITTFWLDAGCKVEDCPDPPVMEYGHRDYVACSDTLPEASLDNVVEARQHGRIAIALCGEKLFPPEPDPTS